MDLAQMIRSTLREQGDLLDTETVVVHPNHTMVFNREAAELIRVQFVRELMEIPNIEGGLSWTLLKSWVGGNGNLAMALIGLGKMLGLWQILPDPERAVPLYLQRNSLLPMSGVVEAWPDWSQVIVDEEGSPRLREPAEAIGYTEQEALEYLRRFNR